MNFLINVGVTEEIILRFIKFFNYVSLGESESLDRCLLVTVL